MCNDPERSQRPPSSVKTQVRGDRAASTQMWVTGEQSGRKSADDGSGADAGTGLLPGYAVNKTKNKEGRTEGGREGIPSLTGCVSRLGP